MSDTSGPAPVLELADAQLRFGERVLWHGLSIDVHPGEFIAILGPNGSGKTSLLKALLGQYQLYSGSARINGHEVHRGDPALGYVPQQRGVDLHTPMRARDLVGMGIDGYRWGPGIPKPGRKRRVNELLASVGAMDYANEPIGTLSGGELQRLRLAQAMASDPQLLLCDEPLLSLDIPHQRLVAHLLDKQRRDKGAAILFVTHEINPILPYVDRVLYIAGGHFLVGTPDEVITTEALSNLFGSRVDVVHAGGRVIIAGGEDDTGAAHHHVPDNRAEAVPALGADVAAGGVPGGLAPGGGRNLTDPTGGAA